MIQAYYQMTYGEYKKHAHRVNGHWHTPDEVLTDSSILTLKVTGDDAMHDYLERANIRGADPMPYNGPHPLVRKRGV